MRKACFVINMTSGQLVLKLLDQGLFWSSQNRAESWYEDAFYNMATSVEDKS